MAIFFDTLNKFSHRYKHIVLGGDLNINLLSNNFDATYFRDSIYSLSLHIVPSGATHHTATCVSWLDVFVVDDMDKVNTLVRSESPFIAGHDFLELSLLLNVELPSSRSVCRRNYRGMDTALFLDRLSANCHMFNVVGAGATELCSQLNEAVIDALNMFAPLKQFVIRRFPVGWLTVDLRARFRARDRLFRQARQSKFLLDYSIYRHYRNQLKSDIRKARN